MSPSKHRGSLPRGPLDALRQVLLFVGAYYLYRIVRGAVDRDPAAAFEHGRRVIYLERSAHLFFEPALQRWVLERPWLVRLTDLMYLNAHVVLTAAFLTWLYLRRNGAFYVVRNMFIVAMTLALLIYLLFPTAPPRLFPEWGFVDSISDWVGPSAADKASLFYNPFAAMPSVHIAFALMVAGSAARVVRTKVSKLLWALYPALMLFVVMATANHFWIDAAAGALVAGLSASLASGALARARPDRWAWANSPA